jgi:hypothetical protein
MPRYLVKELSYIDNKLVEAGEFVELASDRVGENDEHLELAPLDDTPKGKAAAKAEQASINKSVEDAERAEAIKAGLADDAAKPIDDKTPQEVVHRRLAEFKQGNAFR